LTRTETSILRGCAGELAQLLGERALLIELGSGASVKTRLLLDALARPAGYVPVDISQSALRAAASSLARDYPGLDVLPLCADFTQPLRLPRPRRAPARSALFFPGSTIGNFDPPDALQLLRRLCACAGPDGALVIGFDLVKAPARLLAAYDDRAGVTAEFNRNVLRRLNREHAARFELAHFAHRAAWNADARRIEMQLVSLRAQRALFAGYAIDFEIGEPLVTEHCHKYTRESIEQLAHAAGFRVRRTWTDEAGDFAVSYCVAQPR
jgi:L-histidine N-alpha-methyltransferase